MHLRPTLLPLAPVALPAPTPTPAVLDARAVGIMLVLCLIWAIQPISLKAAATEISPMLMVAVRSGIALVLLFGLMVHRRQIPAAGRWRPGVVIGSLFAFEYVLVAEALQRTHASHVVVFLYSAPLFAALGLHLRLPSERLNRLQWMGIALAFGGIAMAFVGRGGGAAPEFASVLLGDLMALLAATLWGATTITIRCSSLSAAPATETLMYQLLGAFVWLLPAGWLSGQTHFHPSASGWAHLAFQTLVMSFASLLVWFWMLRHYLASRLGVFSFLTPLFGVVLGVIWLGEPVSWPFAAGGCAVMAGIVFVNTHGMLTRMVSRPGASEHASPPTNTCVASDASYRA